MTSNTPGGSWSVKIISLPSSITVNELSQTFHLRASRIKIPDVQKRATYYAYINEFEDEEAAKDFVNRWSNSPVLGSVIRCSVIRSKEDDLHDQDTSSNLPKPNFRIPRSTTPHSVKTRPQSHKRNPSKDEMNSNRHPESNLDTLKSQASGASIVRKTITKANVDDKRPLSIHANKGHCRNKSNECKYRHQRCQHFNACFNTSCPLAHEKKEPEESRRGIPMPARNRCRSNSSSSNSSLQSMSSTQSMNRKQKDCFSGIKCFNIDCEFDHPDGWNPCPDGIKCKKYECTANHPYKRIAKCRDGDKCKNTECKRLHPSIRTEQCPLKSKCRKWNCAKMHPRSRPRLCPDKANCTNLTCLYIHPPERGQLLCPSAADCRDLSCKLNHPSERPSICDEPDTCPNVSCTRLHNPDWNPGEDDGSDDEYPSNTYSSRDNTKENENTVTVVANTRKKRPKLKKKSLKSLEQRKKDWDKAQLPILSCREEFCRRLQDEHVLIVTAETGSGKSTQLPQYAAEHFGSLVVCTQPRVVAAISLARRVAEEYDGTSVGESVGYRVGHANRVVGSSIMFMTDAALIRESQRDPALRHIRVLIIDEAHERSLNTDIVLGIAKLLLEQRPNDFYVVIASATIDPARFLDFFNRSTRKPLEVKGRVFPVTMTNKPPPAPPNCSDQTLLEKHLISSVTELYPKHQGHILIFLPGQGEIERALRMFKSKLPNDCVAYPLYGSQSPEDQEKVIKFSEKNKRMVVFCTNVAETSLTIPDVRLVIDSGWAKEARYDTKRRLTVIETVRISRSSAEQRKGRAGRTAPGHCVRLYDDAELKRLNIEPEILRSSLDLVLLQIIRLNFDPKKFPFMDQPESEVISNSIDLLTKLKCIENNKVTKRGELFTELALDLRYSAFIIDIFMEYESLLELAVSTVAILSAPGTIFFMGGATREAKDEAKTRVAVQAQNHKSDLMHLYSVYNEWKNAGTKQTQGKCEKCMKQVKFCICRIKHSNDNGLNNKILQTVHNSCLSIIKQIKNTNWLKPGNQMPTNLIEIISKPLAQLFPEQCGYILVPQLPGEGVRLISADVRANITNTSVFMQKLHTDTNQDLYQHFVAMTITQLPSGIYIIEKLHPIPRALAKNETHIKRLMVIENISSEVFYQMRQKLNDYKTELWAKWVVYQHERSNCRLSIWGLESTESTVIPIIKRIENETLQKLCNAYELLECGPIKANFKSGLLCTHINKMANALRLDLQNLPKQTQNELKDWLKKMIGIEWNEIKEYRFYSAKDETDKKNNDDQNKNLYVIFKSEDTFQRARNNVPPYYLKESNNIFGGRRNGEKETWGRELIIETPGNITTQDIIDRYSTNMIIKCTQLNKSKDKIRVESSLRLNNLPITTDETALQTCLQAANGPKPKDVYIGRAKNDITGWARVTFLDQDQRNRAAVIFNLNLCQNSFPISIPGKHGPKQKYVQTKVETDETTTEEQSQNLPKNRFSVVFSTREETLRIYLSSSSSTMNVAAATSAADLVNASQWKIDSSASVTIIQTDLYPDLEQILDRICEKFNLKVEVHKASNHTKRFTFSDGSPQKTSLAASMLAQNFCPIEIKLITNRQKQLFNELEISGKLRNWSSELHLSINKNKFNTKIEIRGPQIMQGQLMRLIADYSDSFDKRFREHELNTVVAAFFGPQKAASKKLQLIASQWSQKSCDVSFIPKTSTIIVSGQQNVSLNELNKCENEVIQLLDELTATTNDDESDDCEEDDDENDEEEKVDNEDMEVDEDDDDEISIRNGRQERRCVFCKQKSSISTSVFHICGHAYCRCAAQSLATLNSFPLQCKDCQADIHIRDIQNIFSNDERLFIQLLKNSIQNYLKKNAHQDDRIFCPNDQCDGLIKLNLGYQTCLTCGETVCSKCNIVNDELHVGRTCAQLVEEKKRRKFLPQLFAAAKKFVEDNWPLDTQMRPIGRIDENSYLENEYKSLSRFYEGIKVLGHSFPPDLSKGFFAYHGCPFQAITPICQNGFDPKRRSGQAYGRGEYFGVTANVSHGYSQKGGSQGGFSQMIIAFILRCSQVTDKAGFCHVVDNPIDWTYAFNLPVLVVTYGQNSPHQSSPFPGQISKYVDNESPWKSPFRWHWRQDNGQFEPCTDMINELLEKSYERWKLHGGPSTVITPPITRYLDDIPQTYTMDFQNNRQINTKTQYQRAIDRRPTNKPPDNQNWFYRNENGLWTRYESLIQNSIEKGFQLYRLGQGASTVNVGFPGRPESYEINFLKGLQINKTTNTEREIKRE